VKNMKKTTKTEPKTLQQAIRYYSDEQTCIDSFAEVRWPDGKQETIPLPGVDRIFAIEEGIGLVPSVYDTIAASQKRERIPASGTSPPTARSHHD